MLVHVHMVRLLQCLAAMVVVASSVVADVQTSTPTLPAATQEFDSEVGRLIEQLGSPRYVDRQRAQQELVRMGVEAFEPIQAAMSHPDPEVAAAAEHILADLTIPWTTPEDSPAIQKEMQGFGDNPHTLRLGKIQRLAAMSEPGAVAALCRIVRYEVNEHLSRSAALAILRPSEPRAVASADLARRLQKEVATSRRRGAHWVRLYAQQLDTPGATLAAWQQEFDDQIQEYRAMTAALRSEGDDTEDDWSADLHGWPVGREFAEQVLSPRLAASLARQVVVGLGWHLFQLQLDLDRKPDALATFGRVVQHDPEQFDSLAVEAIDRLADTSDWDTLDKLLSKHGEHLASTRRAQYAAAIARQRQGKHEEAMGLAKHALEQPVESPLERIIDAGEFLLERQQWKWAENEYRRVVSSEPIQLQWSLYARFRLADLLYDSEDYAAAVAELQTLEKRIDEDQSFRKSYNQVREVFLRRGVRFALPKELSAQRHFYQACLAHQQGKTEEERTHLVASFDLDPTNPDVLIAMYRADPDNEAWMNEVRERIRTYAENVDKDIRELERGARRSPNDELQQLYNQWAWLVSNTEGDFQKAIRYSKKSLELAPNAAGYLDTLGRCYYAAGDYGNAVKYQRQAVELEPSMQVMQRQLALFEAALAGDSE